MKKVKYLCNFAVSAAMLSLAVLMSSCQRSRVEEYTNVQSQPQLVPQEEKKDTAGTAVQKAEVPAKKAESAVKKAETPAVQKAEVPAKKAEPAAVQKAEVPAKKAESAVKKAETPAKKTAAVRKADVKLPCKHTVRSSDNLWRISMHYYGKGSYWKHIYNANKNVIRKPEFLEPGTVLTIPAVKKGK